MPEGGQPFGMAATVARHSSRLASSDARSRRKSRDQRSRYSQPRVPTWLAEALLRLAGAWEPRLAEVSRLTGLVHCDFNSRNIFVARDGDTWRVSGVPDWEFAIDASPYVDIGNFLRCERPERPRFEPHFSHGLRAGGMELPPDWLTTARVMDLPALCELMTRPGLRPELVAEVLTLIEGTVREAARS